MRYRTKPGTALLLILATLTMIACSKGVKPPADGEKGENEPAPQRSDPSEYHIEKEPATLEAADIQKYQQIFQRFEHLSNAVDLMGQSGSDEKLQQSLESLRSRDGIVEDTLSLYKALTDASRDNYHAFSEARWRTVHLLGELRLPEAEAGLFKIAAKPMPNAERVTESEYSTEYRIQARAIAGLEKLKEVELLKRLYDGNTVLSPIAAGSLYELGQAPEGVVEVDEKKVFGGIESSDFKVKDITISPQRMKLPAIPQREESQRIIPQTNDNQ